MATVTDYSDFGAPENKVYHCFHFFSIYLAWSDGIYMSTVLAASLKWRSQLLSVSPILVLFSSLNFCYHLLPAPLQALGEIQGTSQHLWFPYSLPTYLNRTSSNYWREKATCFLSDLADAEGHSPTAPCTSLEHSTFNCLLYLLTPHLEYKLLKGTKLTQSLHRVDLTENLLINEWIKVMKRKITQNYVIRESFQEGIEPERSWCSFSLLARTLSSEC